MAAVDEDGAPQKMFNFILQQGVFRKEGLRLGQLTIKGRQPLQTPTFIASTSRGVVPHIAQDILSRSTQIHLAYIGLEDFIENTPKQAPILRQPSSTSSSRIRDFVSLPDSCTSILGARRIPPLACPKQNTNSAVSICTSVGFGSLELEDYNQCSSKLQADISISLADIVTTEVISQKRLEKSVDRTHAWLRDTLAERASYGGSLRSLFAAVPPLEPEQQSFYLTDLAEEYRDDIAGLNLSSPETAATLPETLSAFPRLCISDPRTPQEIIRAVALGNDMITIPLVTDTSENGVAMAFSLTSMPDAQNVPLGFDLWSTAHATDLSPLLAGCECYTCTKHHRAYLHHLLTAKEMLAWTLLQIHNFHVINVFFQQLRAAIENGSFDDKINAFHRVYSAEMPTPSGQGPRIRGYQAKSVGGGESRRNEKAYGRLEEHARLLDEADSGLATPETDMSALVLQEQGLGEVQK